MTKEEMQALVFEWINKQVQPQINEHQLREALYTINELRLWPDGVDSVSPEQCLICWQVIQAVAVAGFPDNLRM